MSFQKKNEKKSRTIVSWFRFPFRFLFRWLFRVFSFRVRAVTATTCKLTTTRTILVSIPVPCLQPIILIKTKKNGQRVQRFHTRKRIPPRKKTIIVKASCWPCPILQIQYNTPHYISKDKKDRPSSSTTRFPHMTENTPSQWLIHACVTNSIWSSTLIGIRMCVLHPHMILYESRTPYEARSR